MADPISVTQLNNRVHDLLSTAPELNGIWVIGEISQIRTSSSGHSYFTLKDAGAAMPCVIFKNARSRLDFAPKESMKVQVYGSVDFYPPFGKVQFIVQAMRQSGIGELYIRFEEMKRKLEAEGLFDKARKRPLPGYPRRIGVVTSATGAVIHDIITTSASRFPADIILAPAMVQGEGSAEAVVAGIELLNRYGVDVIIVGRGGGSIEDLWCFNEEKVARAIAASAIPVVSAVGHETDFTIADFVADVRAPTPTGAAAIILRDSVEVRGELVSMMARANRAIEGGLRDMQNRFRILDTKLSPQRALDDINFKLMQLDDLSSRADRALRDTVADMRRRYDLVDAKLSPAKALDTVRAHADRIDSDTERIRIAAERKLESASARMDAVGERPDRAVSQSFASASKELDALSQHLEGMNPMNVLGRGYSMVTAGDGRVIVSVEGISEGDPLNIHLRDGTAVTRVESREMKR